MNATTTSDERVLASYWHETYPNATTRKHHLRQFIERCNAEGIPMDRTTALALSSSDMYDLSKRFFAHSADAARRQALSRSIAQRHVAAMIAEMQAAMPNHAVSMDTSVYNRPCVRVGAWQYALDSLLVPPPRAKL